jgi:hypothetical protein
MNRLLGRKVMTYPVRHREDASRRHELGQELLKEGKPLSNLI